MAHLAATLSITKGEDLYALAEQIRITPAPKLCGVAGPQIRFLSVSREQSIVTDLEVGSLTVQRRVPGLPLMHRMWFEREGEGYSLGYTKRRRIGSPAELYFLDPAARLTARTTLPDAVSEVACSPGCWYVGCRDGALYAFGKDGRLHWRHAIPFEPRRGCSLTSALLDEYYKPELRVAVTGLFVIVAESDHLFAVDSLGRRVWSTTIPDVEDESGVSAPGALPTKNELLQKLGFDPDDFYGPEVGTGYLRLRLDTLLSAGLLKQVEVYDLPDAGDEPEERAAGGFEFGVRIDSQPLSDCRALACSPHWIGTGTAGGKVHLFDTNATLVKSFKVGDAPVSQLAVDSGGLRAAYAGGQLALFSGGRMTGTVRMPEYFADLAVCGDDVLAWRWNSAWLVGGTGRVVWAASTARRIGSALSDAGAFHLLAGQFASLRAVVSPPSETTRRGMR